MHFSFEHVLVLTALVASGVLVLAREDKIAPMIALVATALQALIAFKIISLSSSKFRIDVILPALLAVSAGVAWGRVKGRPATTAATVAALIGILQLLLALKILD